MLPRAIIAPPLSAIASNSTVSRRRISTSIGPPLRPPANGRFATTLSKAEKLSLKPDNLRPLPTPTIGVVIVGADESAGKELLAHILARRQDILLSRGAFIAVLALVGRDGAVHPQRRERAL